MERREFLRSLFLITTNLALVPVPNTCHAVSASLFKKTILIGIFSPSHCAAPLVFAEKRGYFQDEGLKVQLINYPTMATLAQDLLAGRIDLGQLTVPLIFAIHSGAVSPAFQKDLVMPMILGVHGSNLMVSKDSGITRPTDFIGKKIATHTKQTVHYLLVRLYLERHGVNTEKDVNMSIVNLGDLTALLQRSEIDAFMMPEPVNALAEATGKAATHILNRYIWRYHPCCGLATRREYFEKEDNNRVRSLVSAICRASLYINKERNREELVTVLRKTSYGFQLLPRKVIDIAFAFSRSAFYPFPYQSTALLLLRMMREYRLLPTIDVNRTAREVFLSDFIRECLSGIGKKAPRSNNRPEIVFGRPFELET